MSQILADATSMVRCALYSGFGLSVRREASFRVSFAASFRLGKFIQNPRPIVFGIGVFIGMLSRWYWAGRKQGIRRWNIQPEVIGIPSGIDGVFDGDGMRRIVLAIQESGQAEDAVAVGTSGIATKGNGKQFQRAFFVVRE
jgi:hypothetical protein